MNPRVRWLLQFLPLIGAMLLATWVVWTWSIRLSHPYDLEWMEGGMLAHAWRLEQGLPLYPPPGRDWIPFIYPAGYASLLALLGEVFGLSHGLGRALSAVGTLAAAAALVHAARVHGGSWRLGLIGAGLFLGCYRLSGAFYDLVRLDGVSVGLLAWAIALGLERRKGAVPASAMLLAAAFLVKQHAAVFGLPMVLGIGLRDGRESALKFALWSALPAIAGTLYMQLVSSGNYLVYLLGVPASHGLKGTRSFPGTPRELAMALSFPLLLCVVWVVVRSARPPRQTVVRVVVPLAVAFGAIGAAVGVWLPQVSGTPSADWYVSALGVGGCAAAAIASICGFAVGIRRRSLSWRYAYGVGVGGMMLVVAALMRGHVGGFINVHMPLHWVVCLGGVLAVARWQAVDHGWRAVVLGEGALLAQAGALIYLFGLGPSLVPTYADRDAGDGLVEAVAAEEGPVLSPFNPWVVQQAGHTPSWHLIALWDINHKGSPMRAGVDDIEAAVASGYWPTFLDAEGRHSMHFGAKIHYDGERVVRPGVLAPKTGWRARPVAIRHPVEEAAP